LEGPFVLTRGSLPAVFPLIRRYAGSSVLAARWGIHADDSERAGFVSELLREGLVAGRIEAIAGGAEDKISGALLWERLPWDSEILGTSCARILMLAGGDCGRLLSFWRDRAESLGIVYVVIRVPAPPPDVCSTIPKRKHAREPGSRRTNRPRDSIDGLLECSTSSLHGLLAEQGFSKIERLVFMSRAVEGPDPEHEVTAARPEDIETMAAIAASSYSYDRFHAEPLFPGKAADRIHERWCRGSFAGRADAILTVRDAGGVVAGYCTCILPRRSGAQPGWIDMIAVRGDSRRAGYGRTLVLGALRFFRNAAAAAAALSTQGHNRPAFALYEKLGFRKYFEAVTYRVDLGGGRMEIGGGA
jgi:ribosomal protein S18 acetylase RimI-like enzyme